MQLKILYALILCMIFLLYPILNNETQQLHIVKTWVDDYIPLIPVFSIPYLLYIPYITFTLTFFVFFSKYKHSITFSVISCILIASLFYVFYQTTVPRTEILSRDLFSRLIELIYLIDKPYNCFPSLHVTLSVLVCFYWKKLLPGACQLSLFFLTFLIVLSTVFVKQHYIPDLLSGIILALLGYFIGMFFSQEK